MATAAAARRRGYRRQVIAALLAAGHDDGQAFSNLYPFRESFYERLGYVTLPQTRIARFAPSAVTSLLGRDLGGRIELALIGDGPMPTATTWHACGNDARHGLLRPRRPGRGRAQPQLAGAGGGRGQTVGLMLYDLKGDEPTKFLFRALRFYYDSAQGRTLLLQWIARHVDQADRVELWLAPDEQPETWLADLQVKTESDTLAPLGRVLDVAGSGGWRLGRGDLPPASPTPSARGTRGSGSSSRRTARCGLPGASSPTAI